MEEKDYTVEGRQFRTESDYARALRDKKLIDEIRSRVDLTDRGTVEKLLAGLKEGKYRFHTLLGQDFEEELEEALKRTDSPSGRKKPGRADKAKAVKADKPKGMGSVRTAAGKRPGDRGRSTAAGTGGKSETPEMEASVREELARREKRRKLIILLCSAAALVSFGYFGIYSWYQYRTADNYEKLSDLKEKAPIVDNVAPPQPTGPLYTLDGTPEPREVLDEYKNLLIKYKKLIGWLTFDDKSIGGESGFPVMQTSDNEYYLTHNMNQEYDKNGTIFLDTDCDILKPSTNFIVYGHHMKNGGMFGRLDLYEKQEYCEEHPYIRFDTIYEKGTYQVMYVFRSKVYREDEIVFKYYQFIDANSEIEFDSYMEEMASMSLYDTGVTAQYGDQLLTLSTCDYQEKDGRFVVVAKKIKE